MPDKLIPGKKKTPVYYAVSSKKSPAKQKPFATPFKMPGFSYPGKAPKASPTKFNWMMGAISAASKGVSRGGFHMGGGGALGLGARGWKGGVRDWNSYQQNKPYNRGWWNAGSGYSRNRGQWGAVHGNTSSGYGDQPYELRTHTG